MNEHIVDQQAVLRGRLRERLRPLMADPGGGPQGGLRTHGQQLFSYCAYSLERLAHVTLEHPSIGIVLRGRKELWVGGIGRHQQAGSVFVLPGGVAFDVVNVPDERIGLYESLIVAVPELPEEVAPMRGPGAGTGNGEVALTFNVALTDDRVEALAHAAASLSASAHAATLGRLRLAEVLLLLRDEPSARPLFARSLADVVRWLVCSAPAYRWTVEEVARRLGVAGSTLRRRLKADRQSFRGILRSARLEQARDALAADRVSVAEAAQLAGYTSRSHFASAFRAAFGRTPAAHRRADDRPDQH